MINYKIADVIFGTEFKYGYSEKMMQEYRYSGDEKAAFTINVSEKELKSALSENPEFPEFYHEFLSIYRHLCTELLNYGGFIFHASALAVDGQGYLFTAPSGTGKSTHARLWRELLGDNVVMVNDDKPLIRKIGDEFKVFGTPWNGKHRLSSNISCPVRAICVIEQAKENEIKKITSDEALPTLFNQTLRFDDLCSMDKLISLINGLLKQVELYNLKCNISAEAAKMSYEAMTGRKT